MNLAGGAAKAFIVKIAGVVLYFAFTVFLARAMSKDDYGTTMYAITVMTVLSPLCLLGYDRVALKFAAMYTADGDRPHLAGVLRRSRQLGLGANLVWLVAGVAAAGFGLYDYSQGLGQAVLLGLLVLPLWTWMILNREYQRGLKVMLPALLGFHILRPALATLFAVIALAAAPLTANAALICLGAAILVAVILDGFRIRRALGGITPKFEPRKWAQTARPLLFSTIMNAISARADMLLIGWLLTMSVAAEYAVALRLAALLAFSLDAVRIAIAPMISELYHRNHMAELQAQVTRASQWIFLATVPLALLLVLFARPVLGLFGPEYVAADNILIVLIIGQTIGALAGPAGVLMTMTAIQHDHAKIMVVTTALFLILGVVLIQTMGAIGVAFAYTVTTLTRNGWMVVVVKKKLNIISHVRLRPGEGWADLFADARRLLRSRRPAAGED